MSYLTHLVLSPGRCLLYKYLLIQPGVLGRANLDGHQGCPAFIPGATDEKRYSIGFPSIKCFHQSAPKAGSEGLGISVTVALSWQSLRS